VPFEPIDGPDSRFGQLNKPIGKAPYYEAGIKGFEPAQPFKLPAHFSTVPTTDNFYWPCLSELNDELCPYPWLPGEKEAFDRELSTVQDVPTLYTGPPPAPPVTSPPSIPDIATMAAKIIASADRLFFVAIGPVSSSYREWRLVRVAFDDSIALHPACLQDGRRALQCRQPTYAFGFNTIFKATSFPQWIPLPLISFARRILHIPLRSAEVYYHSDSGSISLMSLFISMAPSTSQP
jgi:hypothetical protein